MKKCSYSGCEVIHKPKCEIKFETVLEQSCGFVHTCPVCPELRDSYDPPSVGSYDPPSVGPYDPPSVGSYDPPSVGHYDPPSVGSHDPPSVDYYDTPSVDSYAPQDDSKSPLSKILTGLRN